MKVRGCVSVPIILLTDMVLLYSKDSYRFREFYNYSLYIKVTGCVSVFKMSFTDLFLLYGKDSFFPEKF